jgi:hypothetical protein
MRTGLRPISRLGAAALPFYRLKLSETALRLKPGKPPATGQSAVFNPTSEVETADNADDADKQELGGETGRTSPKHTLSMKPVSHP